jgi:hypothetical protein
MMSSIMARMQKRWIQLKECKSGFAIFYDVFAIFAHWCSWESPLCRTFSSMISVGLSLF